MISELPFKLKYNKESYLIFKSNIQEFSEFKSDLNYNFFCFDNFEKDDIIIRNLKNSDKIKPFKFDGTKTVKKIFGEKKISVALRPFEFGLFASDNTLIVCNLIKTVYNEIDFKKNIYCMKKNDI